MAKMKAEELQIDLEELKEFKRKNAQERLWFIDFYVNYLKKQEFCIPQRESPQRKRGASQQENTK